MIELQLPDHALLAKPRYTNGNSFMTEESRPSRTSNVRGIKSFEGNAAPLSVFHQDPDNYSELLRYGARVWRTDEAIEAAKLLAKHGRVAIAGAPQSGKGTILYGVSCICDTENTGYVMIDGHWQDTPGDVVAGQIHKANQEGKVIFYDSFDYNFAGSGKIRRLSKNAQKERTGTIVQALEQTTVPLVLTQHDEYHERVSLDQDLIKQHSGFVDTVAVYDLPKIVASAESRFMFFVDHDLSHEQAEQLISLPDDQGIKQKLAERVENGDYIDEFALALSDYGTMKELVRGSSEDTKRLLDQIKNEIPGAREEFIGLALNTHFQLDFTTTLRRTK